MLIEDQFLAARNELFKVAEHRALDLTHNKKILTAIETVDSGAAETATRNYMLAVRDLHLKGPAEKPQAPEREPKRRPRQTTAKSAI
jgi:hypothetical protein